MKLLLPLVTLTVSLAFYTSAARAEIRAKGTLIENADGHFIDFGHGYLAQLFIGTQPSFEFHADMKLNESTCEAFTGPVTCVYTTRFSMNKVNWLWVKNPDRKRVGQIVAYEKRGQPLKNLDGNIAYKTVYAPLRHAMNEKPDTLRCERLDWMPKAARERNLITTWYSSNMGNNSETGAAENRALFALVGVHLKSENGALSLVDYDEAQTFTDFFINPFVHDQQTMILNDGAKNCQVNWMRRVPAEENKRYFDAQMRAITKEAPVPVKTLDLFTANQIKAGVAEFTRQVVRVR